MENTLNNKRKVDDKANSDLQGIPYTKIRNEEFSKNNHTLKKEENSQNRTPYILKLLNKDKKKNNNVKSKFKKILLESDVDVVVGCRIIEAVIDDDLTIFEIEQKISHKYYNNKIEQSMKGKIKHQLYKLVELGYLEENFSTGYLYSLTDTIRDSLREINS